MKLFNGCALAVGIIMLSLAVTAQELVSRQERFSRADTLRGSNTPERAWWDVRRYDLTIVPDFEDKYTAGTNRMTYQVVDSGTGRMQLDLKPPLKIDSVVLASDGSKRPVEYAGGDIWYVDLPLQQAGTTDRVNVYFSGNPHIAIRPPWDGGWTFSRDSLDNPWMTVCCQGLGASVWFPCKDHQSDEPDDGASLTMVVPDTLQAVGNGRLVERIDNHDGTMAYTWEVTNPINNYCMIPYIGKYASINDTYIGEKGKLDLQFWPLQLHKAQAERYFPEQAKKVLRAFEYWFGPYPFYEDSYKLVEADNTGMEHQSNIGYGNFYAFGYRGRDASGTGYGLLSDFIIVHESAHEWWGNSITTNDLADMWVHESFANYAEALYVEYHWGIGAGNDYVYGVRRGIRNDKPIVPPFGVNAQGSGDMYPKGGNMLHTIRHSMADDTLFREILRGLQREHAHQTIDGEQLIAYFCDKTGYDYRNVFAQYLTTVQIPEFRFYFEDNRLFYKWQHCIDGFNLPIALTDYGSASFKLFPTATWQSVVLTDAQKELVTVKQLEYLYYISAVEGR
ncbi:M1 family metallopeptidase [Parapedobacter sp. ISTM3]|uniref:Peptidase family M1 n=1 Tax=Parapedobacter luteus TaxID=623280 RepID=A0A1T4ZVU3_9SPHI|nr:MULTISPECIES: M1 family metallopeptidase [Parapedobacter]MBK1438702.1 M1 family metallopeptidase [Parapedobacter sp. ISTM3]SKB26901.1 Peptidase family M1 [Parapedobacter luteus]